MQYTAPLAFVNQMTVPARVVHLLLSLALCAVSIRMMINAGVGVSPWDVLHIGLSLHIPFSIGQATIIASAVVVAYTWLVMREKPGLGTILNALEIGLLLDVLADIIPHPVSLLARWVQFLLGVGLCGFGTAAYISAGFGSGPRDGLMLAIHRVYGWPINRVRTAIELAVLGVGALLGGPLGWGTLVFALLVGSSVSKSMELFGLRKTGQPA